MNIQDAESLLYNPVFHVLEGQVPVEETLAQLKLLYEDTKNPLFAWEAFRIAAPLGISVDWVQYYLMYVAFSLVECAKMSLRKDNSVFTLSEVPKQLGLTDKKTGPGHMREFAFYLRDSWIYAEMQRRTGAGEGPKQAKNAVALAQDPIWGQSLSEDRIERIWRKEQRRRSKVTPNLRRITDGT